MANPFTDYYEKLHGFPSGTLSALIEAESGGKPTAISKVGARGLTQVMPGTSKDPGFGVRPMQDQSSLEQIRFGAEYLAAMRDRYGSMDKALAAYNAGPGAVDKYGGVPPYKETQGYVKKILGAINPISAAQAEERAPVNPFAELSKQRGPVNPFAGMQQQQQAPAAAPEGRPQPQPLEFGEGLAMSAFDVDINRGAPKLVRADVGSARSPEDKLNTLRRYYPDARPYGEDNYVFKDPKTGKWTLYNPKGLDLGDVAEQAPTIAQMMGAGVGAAGAGAASLLAGPFAPAVGPVAVGAGAGLGAAAGEQLYNLTRQAMGSPETRTMPEQLIGAAETAGLVGASGAIGETLGAGLGAAGRAISRKVMGARKPGVTPSVIDYEQLGLTPMMGGVSTRPSIKRLETAVGAYPGGSRVAETYKTNLEGLQSAAQRIGEQYGKVYEKAAAGSKIKQAAATALGGIEAKVSAKYEKAFNMVGADAPVSLQTTKAFLDKLSSGIMSQSPQFMGARLGPFAKQVEGILADAEGGKMTFSALRDIKTAIGENITNPVISGASSGANKYYKQLYDALLQDTKAVAQSVNPNARTAIESADRYYRALKRDTGAMGSVPLLEKLSKVGSDTKAFNAVMEYTQNPRQLGKILRNMNPEDKGMVAGSILGRLGVKQNQAGIDAFNPGTFLNNWNKIDSNAKKMLFEGTRYKGVSNDIDRLVRVSNAMVEEAKLGNPSGTAGTQAFMWLMGGLTGFASGSATVGLGAVSSSVLGSMATARLMTNPSFLKWMTNTIQHPPGPNGWGATLGRLLAIEDGPGFKDSIRMYVDQLGAQ